MNYVHTSVDDVITPLRNLFEGGLASVWHEPTFAYLHELHERYGLVFSLYVFYQGTDTGWCLDRADERYRDEFAQVSPWLRFGFHALDQGFRYGEGSSGEREAKRHFGLVTAALTRMAGAAAMDQALRVHYYTGSLKAARAWRDAPGGIGALLTADDERSEVYYLNAHQRAQVRERGELYDAEERLWLFCTDLRLENCAQPAEALSSLAARRRGAHVFTHEPYLADAGVRARLEAVGEWMKENEIEGGFPLERLLRSPA